MSRIIPKQTASPHLRQQEGLEFITNIDLSQIKIASIGSLSSRPRNNNAFQMQTMDNSNHSNIDVQNTPHLSDVTIEIHKSEV